MKGDINSQIMLIRSCLKYSFFLIVVILAILAGFYFGQKQAGDVISVSNTATTTVSELATSTPVYEMEPISTATSSEILDWEKYQNVTYGFEFLYPASSTIRVEQDTNYQYIRLQNYISDGRRGSFGADSYYFEIFIFDEKFEHTPDGSCQESIINPQKVMLGTGVGYRGLPNMEGYQGDAIGGDRFILCSESSGVQIYIQGTEIGENSSIVNQILDSFKFVN